MKQTGINAIRKQNVSFWTRLSDEAREELKLLLADSAIKYEDIAREFNTTKSNISYWAIKLGYKRHPRAPLSNLAGPVAVETPEEELQRLSKRMEEVKELVYRRRVRVEESKDGDVSVFGIYFNGAAVEATTDEWRNWLKFEGPRLLREYLSKPRGKSK